MWCSMGSVLSSLEATQKKIDVDPKSAHIGKKADQHISPAVSGVVDDPRSDVGKRQIACHFIGLIQNKKKQDRGYEGRKVIF